MARPLQTMRSKAQRRLPALANRTPSAPPVIAKTRLSVSSWRISRALRAPSACRTASSRALAVERANKRFAMLAQAISNTSATTAIRIFRGSENLRRSEESPVAIGVSGT